MAHPTDYASMQDIHKLKKSSQPHSYDNQNAYHLVLNFLRSNPNWSIDSLVTYCLRQYSDFGVNRSIISQAITTYISED
jgi:hypothetical protein